MELENSSLYREVNAIIYSPVKPVHFSWTADIHVGDTAYGALKVLSIDLNLDYENNYGDEILVTLALSGGTYAKRIYPFQGNLDITLYRSPLAEIGDVADTENLLQTERYSATLIDKGDPLLEANGANSATEETLNLTTIMEVSFQLVNKALEQMRMISIGGIYRYTAPGDIVKNILTKESKAVKVDNARLPQGVNMVEASNKEKRDHVIIPQGTKLVNLPNYVHYKCGGVYNAGMGYYFQGDYWYLYPCYDTTRFNKETKTLTVINIPRNKFPNIERTYRKDGDNLVVLATGEVKFNDDSDQQQLMYGNGVRFADANKFMEGFATIKGNKAVASRGGTNNEFMASPRENGKNNILLSNRPINANTFVETSKLARREGSILSFVWENSNTALIFPGMLVKLLYLEDEEIKTVFGVMLKCHHFVHTQGEGLTTVRHLTNSGLSVFVKRPEEDD